MKTYLTKKNKFFSFYFAFALFVFSATAQKKVLPVTQSAITSMQLPAGSKQDTRMLYEAAGKSLLQTEAQKLNTTVSAVEIIYIPVQSAFTADLMMKALTANGWTVSATGDNPKYTLLKKNNQTVLAYYEKKADINLYFGIIGNTNTGGEGNNSTTSNNSNITTAPPVQPKEANNPTAPPSNNGLTTQQIQEPTQNTNSTAIADGFQFTTSNFDDGWVSTVQQDWVEVRKGEIIVLLHYPREEDKKYITQQDEKTRTFWNLLVAPRYSSLSNFELLNYNHSSEPAYYAAGNLVDKSGKTVYVTLFSKAKSGWIEIITPDKNSFINHFHINNPDGYFGEWEPLLKLANYNKFAVGPSDLKGKWSNDFSSVSSLYNIYTGIYVGGSSYSSRQTFTFTNLKNYQWEINVAKGGPGGMNVDRAKSEGIYQLKGNWQISFSNIDKKAKLYNTYFSCIKGARILWLQDVEYGSYSSYGLVK